MLGLSLDVAGRRNQAIALFRVGIQRDPGNVKCLRELAWILATARDHRFRNGSEALELAERLVELSPADPDLRNVLAAAYAETRQFEKALVEAEQGIQFAKANNNKVLLDFISICRSAYKSGQPLRTN